MLSRLIACKRRWQRPHRHNSREQAERTSTPAVVNGCRSAEANSAWTACRRTQLSQNVGAAPVMVVVVCLNGDGGCARRLCTAAVVVVMLVMMLATVVTMTVHVS